MSDFRDELAKRFSYVGGSIIEPSTSMKVDMANSLKNAGIIETPQQYVEYIQTGSFTPTTKRTLLQKIKDFLVKRIQE